MHDILIEICGRMDEQSQFAVFSTASLIFCIFSPASLIFSPASLIICIFSPASLIFSPAVPFVNACIIFIWNGDETENPGRGVARRTDFRLPRLARYIF